MRGGGLQGTARNRAYTSLCPWTCALTPRQVSCICIALFACQHAFRAREPLPQFLPSSRHALRTLEDHVHARLQQAREEDPDALGLSARWVQKAGWRVQEAEEDGCFTRCFGRLFYQCAKDRQA